MAAQGQTLCAAHALPQQPPELPAGTALAAARLTPAPFLRSRRGFQFGNHEAFSKSEIAPSTCRNQDGGPRVLREKNGGDRRDQLNPSVLR